MNAKRIVRLLKAVTFVVLSLLFLASIATPDSGPTISTVYAFRHVLEPNDMLLVGLGDIPYAVNPTETAAQAFVYRTLDATAVERANTAPEVYNVTGTWTENGYEEGAFSMYVAADVATAMWDTAITVKLEGNVLMTWVPTRPNVSFTTITWYSTAYEAATDILLRLRVIDIASALGTAWGLDLIEDTTDGTKLTADGAAYFDNVIPGLRVMVPTLYPSAVQSPDFKEKTYTKSYIDQLKTLWDGTQWDYKFQQLADATHLSKPTVKALLYLIPITVIAYFIGVAAADMRPALFLVLLSLPIGGRIGMIDLTIGLVVGFILLLALGLTLWHSRSST